MAMEVALQVVVVAWVPLNVTVPDVPRFNPWMVTGHPTGPRAGSRLLMAGSVPGTVNSTLLLQWPLTRTPTAPSMAVAGTVTRMLVSLQALTEARAPLLKYTLLWPCAAPKLTPVIVTGVPGGAVDTDNWVIVGERTVKGTELLAIPFT